MLFKARGSSNYASPCIYTKIHLVSTFEKCVWAVWTYSYLGATRLKLCEHKVIQHRMAVTVPRPCCRPNGPCANVRAITESWVRGAPVPYTRTWTSLKFSWIAHLNENVKGCGRVTGDSIELQRRWKWRHSVWVSTKLVNKTAHE